MHEKKITFDDSEVLSLFSYNDSLLSLIENKFNTAITVRGNTLLLRGNPSEIRTIESIFNELKYVYKKQGTFSAQDITTIIDLLDTERKSIEHPINGNGEVIVYHGYRDVIKTRGKVQSEYYKKVQENDLVFAIGPAGTGKTFLAVAMALASLKNNEVGKIILSRPAVEAGESLGFLPGDLNEKLDPYIKPLTDALFYMLSPDKMKSMLEKNIIEITPLAYMRGRTLNNSFIILDEAQNATSMQMKMFLTRMSSNSKAIVTGDVTQIDLPDKNNSGLIEANRLLKKIKGIEFIYFSDKDIVRHRLVAEIVKAYNSEDKKTTKK
ncbi:MAG: phosphate starvation-inducible protein PhoH [Ignavibacteria bacterium GWB2_35_12]|nr:MAG: phosphate starvation-inducible protein PhoH [Ignavibacteria bacterium GWB2_35_12]OGU87418.1 MAG: phosphate starvation-inducible protein PhoH [Ignavibacteria bacterium RIFOXYA2_FULL_35_10]OGV22063.1 MAG: phosphate starvation-inducible protein PhoH [Ignavibacteria bacterium RIFOXYC2_FULL_35_21]